ncbi:RHS repeat-associated core domain-containing protein [Niveispirillum sp. KHB5.9]|uniref:RHS repeat-associated core domain-containing protein n=1 Tax=Niveispirillum sp. KHB5.9 TaxID=3400269 RepID=UPI003A85A9F8
MQSPAGGLIRQLLNRQGSVVGWLRPDGKLGGAYTYDAYGNSPQAAAAGPSFRYAGMRYDAETGLYHTPNRAYDPQDGRWMQLDPIGIKDGLNRYAYVRNSPYMGVDPTGLYVDPMGNWYPWGEVERGFDYNPLEHPVATGAMMAAPPDRSGRPRRDGVGSWECG